MHNIFKIVRFTDVFRKWYIFMAVSVVITSLLGLVTPFLLKNIVDIIVAGLGGAATDGYAVVWLLMAIFLVDVTVTGFTAYSTWLGDILAAKLQSHLTTVFYKHLLSLDVAFFDNEITGNVVNKMYRGIESISDFVQNATNNFLPFFLTAFVTIGILAKYSPVIAVLLAILFPAYIVISHNSTKAWNRHQTKINALTDQSQGRVLESFIGIRVVKAFIGENIELQAYRDSRKSVENVTVIQSRQWHMYDFYRRLTLNVILFAILAYIIYFTYRRVYTIGEMTLLIQLVNQARFPLFAMSFILSQIQRADSGSKDFFELIEKPVGIRDAEDARQLDVSASRTAALPFIEFRNVSFRYESEKKVLHDISFAAKKGEMVALVGESGQGKSTIVNLLLRYYEPQTGSIEIAGQDLRHVTQKSLRERIAVVFQESLLFSGSIAENIKYGNPSATEKEVMEAAKAANAYEFVKDLPDGFDSVIGERGVKLSGGQKQRISIARAMLKNAPIIVLDEATSSLDSRSEILVQQGLDRLMENRTSLIIAHRLSTIANADKILVIAGGTIAQFGTPKELLKMENGPYARMVKLQRKLLSASPEERLEALQKYDLVA